MIEQLIADKTIRDFLSSFPETCWTEVLACTTLLGIQALKKEKGSSSVSFSALLEKANFQPQGKDTHGTNLTRESSGKTSMEQALKGMREQIESMQKALEKREELAPSLPIKVAPKVTLMGRSQPKKSSGIKTKPNAKWRRGETNQFEDELIHPNWWYYAETPGNTGKTNKPAPAKRNGPKSKRMTRSNGKNVARPNSANAIHQRSRFMQQDVGFQMPCNKKDKTRIRSNKPQSKSRRMWRGATGRAFIENPPKQKSNHQNRLRNVKSKVGFRVREDKRASQVRQRDRRRMLRDFAKFGIDDPDDEDYIPSSPIMPAGVESSVVHIADDFLSKYPFFMEDDGTDLHQNNYKLDSLRDESIVTVSSGEGESIGGLLDEIAGIDEDKWLQASSRTP